MKYKRRICKRKINNQRKIIIICLLIISLSLSFGYGAFNTNINLNSKGNIGITPKECFTVSDNGDGTGTITDYDKNCGTKVKIPDKINNLTIEKIGAANWNGSNYQGSFANKGITYVKLPSTLKEIGTGAFFSDDISKLNIPYGVVKIMNNSFRGNKLEDLIIPDTVTTIGNWAFLNNKLTIINIPSSVTSLGGGAFTNNRAKENRYIYGRNSDGSINNTVLSSYAYNTAEGEKIPDTVVKIDTSAYEEIYYPDVEIPERITYIAEHAFSYCKIKNEINISNKITYIGDNAFTANENLIININRKEGAIANAPWGAINSKVNWIGTD